MQVLTDSTLEESLATNTDQGTLRILGGRDFLAANGLTNDGTIELGGGFLSAPSLDNTPTGEIFGFGTIAPAVQNAGTVRATGGTLTVQEGILASSGTVISEDGATLVIEADSSADVLDLQGGALALGPHAFTVGDDYRNAAFGSGNAFDRRANVSGSGQIIGQDADMALGEDGAPGVIDFGMLRGGTSDTRSFTVENSGSGAQLRGALQTAAGTGSITDARLSGAGVTAQDFGPLAAGDSSAPFDITFEATQGGALTGQTVGVVQNFDNVADLTLQLDGFATALAEGALTPPGPLDLGNFRVGEAAPGQVIGATNLTTGAGAEDLGISGTSTTGNFAATNLLGGGLVAPGASQPGAVEVAVAGGEAGVNSGEVTVQFTSDGTAFDAGFTTTDSNSATVALSATGYRVAQAEIAPDPVQVGPQRVGGSETTALSITNTAAADGFSESLNASAFLSSGDAFATGSVMQLAAGATDSGGISVGVDTSAAGTRSGSVLLRLQSDGTGSSGLGTLDLPNQPLNVTGDVYQPAQGQLNTPALNFGTVQVGTMIGQTLSITNSASGPAGYVEDLGVTFGATQGTGAGQISGGGSIAALAAGSTDNAAMTVTVDTSTAGSIDGAIALNYTSTGTVGGVATGLAPVAVGSDLFGVLGTIEATGNIVDQAAPVIETPQPIDLGNVRLGAAAPSAGVAVRNAATGNDQAALNASIAGDGGAVLASGSFDLLAPGDVDSTSLTVSMDTANAGAVNGQATLSLVSDASNIGGCAPNCELALAPQQVAVTGGVYRLANPVLDTPTVALVARRGDATPGAAIGVTNESPDAFTEALDASMSAAPAGFTASGSISGLAAGASDAGSLSVGLETAVAGSFGGALALDFVSSGAGTTGAADVGVGSGSVALSGRVYEAAQAQLDTPTIDFGTLRVGDTVTPEAIALRNAAPVAGLNDTLSADFADLPAGPFAAAGAPVSGLAAGESASSLAVGLDTSTAGVFGGTASVGFASSNPEMADLDLGSETLTLAAQVNNLVNPVFTAGAGTGSLSGGGTAFLFDFGTLSLGDSVSATLGLVNDVAGPADAMHGSFDLSAISDFGLLGFDAFADVAAGDGVGLLELSFAAVLEGTVAQTLTLTGFGRNDSGPDLGFAPISLTLRADVRDATGVIPLPAPLWLLLGGLGSLGLLRRRQRRLR